MMSAKVVIREAVSSDKATLEEIIDLSFPRFFRFFAAHSVNSEGGKLLVSENQGMAVGFAKLIEFNVSNGKYGCILWIAVHPNHRRKGIASMMIRAGIEDLKRGGAGAVFASVQRRNRASLAVFHKEGFERAGFIRLWQLFGWRIFQFYRDIWLAPGEVVLMHA